MHRTFSLHPASLVLGLVFGVLVLISMSQVMPPTSNVLVGYGPNPRDMVQIREGTPYIVPAGKLFVLTGVGSIFWSGSGAAMLSVDGQPEISGGLMWMGSQGTALAEGNSVARTPVGFTVAAGSTITVSGGGNGRAWGYVAPQ